jgi:hypothetical protein
MHHTGKNECHGTIQKPSNETSREYTSPRITICFILIAANKTIYIGHSMGSPG